MFFEKTSDIPKIATKVSCSVFVVPPETKIQLKSPLYLQPSEDRQTEIITVEQLRDFLEFTNSRETKERFFIITPANAMNEAAQNAFLKTFEEPKEHCHFILLTEQPSALLPTIISRAQVFYLRKKEVLNIAPNAKEKIISIAKRMIVANPKDLVKIAEEITKNKTKPRQQALDVTATAIELLYKSYFKTGNEKFLEKLPRFIRLHDSLTRNGHIKLHLVADLL